MMKKKVTFILLASITLLATVLLVYGITSWQHTIPWDITTEQFQVTDMQGGPVPSGLTSTTVTQFPYNSEQYKIKNTGNVAINITLAETWIGTGTANWTVTGATAGTTFPIKLNPSVEAVASLSLNGTSVTGSYDWRFDLQP